jgi:hypothetical protein
MTRGSWVSISEIGTTRQHGFVKCCGLVRDDRHDVQSVMVPFRMFRGQGFVARRSCHFHRSLVDKRF